MDNATKTAGGQTAEFFFSFVRTALGDGAAAVPLHVGLLATWTIEGRGSYHRQPMAALASPLERSTK